MKEKQKSQDQAAPTTKKQWHPSELKKLATKESFGGTIPDTAEGGSYYS